MTGVFKAFVAGDLARFQILGPDNPSDDILRPDQVGCPVLNEHGRTDCRTSARLLTVNTVG